MFLTNDKLVILRDMGPVLVASCEGVVGWVRREDVRFHRPQSPGHADVIASPMSKSQSGRSLRSQLDIGAGNVHGGSAMREPQTTLAAPGTEGAGGFKSVVVSPSPPQHQMLLPEQEVIQPSETVEDPLTPSSLGEVYSTPRQSPIARAHDTNERETNDPSPNLSPFPSPGLSDMQRISNQFDFDSSPLHTPGSSTLGSSFVDVRAGMPVPNADGMVSGSRAEPLDEVAAQLQQKFGAEHRSAEEEEEEQLNERTNIRTTRESVASMASMQSDTSSALGGIGGLLLGGGGVERGNSLSMASERGSLQRLMSGMSSLLPRSSTTDQFEGLGLPARIPDTDRANEQARLHRLSSIRWTRLYPRRATQGTRRRSQLPKRQLWPPTPNTMPHPPPHMLMPIRAQQIAISICPHRQNLLCPSRPPPHPVPSPPRPLPQRTLRTLRSRPRLEDPQRQARAGMSTRPTPARACTLNRANWRV